jgi:hypothetical protein
MGATQAQRPPPVSCASVPVRHMAGDAVWATEPSSDVDSATPGEKPASGASPDPRPVVSVKHVVESTGGLSTLASVVETTLAPAVGQPPIRRTSIPVREVGGPKGPVASRPSGPRAAARGAVPAAPRAAASMPSHPQPS